MTEDISAVKLQQKSILDLVEEVKALHIQNAEKDRRLVYLESRVAELEQYTSISDVIITGLRIKPRSYAHVVTVDNGGDQVFNRWLPFFNPRGLITSRHTTLCPGEMTATNWLSS